MARRIGALGFLLAAAIVAMAQDDDEESIIEVDAGPGAPEESTEKPREKQPPPTASPKRTPGEKHPFVEHKDAEGTCTIRLPDDWVAAPLDARDAVLGFDLRLPGSESFSRLIVLRQENLGDPRAAPLRWRESVTANLTAPETEVLQDKVPRLIVRHEQGGDRWVAAYGFRRLHGNGFVVRLECRQEDFADAATDFVTVVDSFEADVPPFPPVPEGYSVKKKGRFAFVIHPAVRASIAVTQKVLASQEKRFAKFHGSLAKPARGEETTVYVHLDRSQARSLLEAAANASSDHYVDWSRGCLFTVPLKKGDVEQAGLLAAEAQGLFFLLKYGSPDPLWVYIGERGVARAEEVTGKSLPILHEGMVNWRQNTTLGTLDVLPGLRESNWESFSNQAFFYVCFFRAGPSKYRSAYQDFLREVATTFDAEAARRTHIDALGFDDLKTQAIDFMNFKLVPYRPK